MIVRDYAVSTIFDVAHLARVSRSTVSRVLNNQPGVSEEARERVLQAITDLNYQPHFAARALKRQKADTLGLIIPSSFRQPTTSEPRGYYLTEIIRGAYNVLTEQRQMLALLDDRGNPDSYDRLIQQRQVDGILMVDINLNEPLLAHFAQRDFPFVVIGNPDDPRVTCVDVDNYGSAQQAVRFLHSLGHRQIALIGGPQERLASRDRLAGYQAMMRELELPLDERLQADGDFSEESGCQAMACLLSRSPRPTAVFATNDRMAIGAIRAVRDQGLEVPDDISIVGFDDIPVAPYLNPPLTSFRQPLYDLGGEAARLLLQLTNESRPTNIPQCTILPTRLMARATTGPPPP
jgi:DNA-binding LacI/PurR family transcriptional regulator